MEQQETFNDPKPISQILEGQSSSTKLEENYEYVLTAEEEKIAIDHAIKREKDFVEWKLIGVFKTKREVMEKMAEINFSERVNVKDVLRIANENKLYQLWEQGQREKEREEVERKRREAKEFWTAKRMFSLMRITSEKKFDKKFVMDEHNEKLIRAVCYMLSDDPRIETELGFSANKGLLIRGVSGLGKTYVVRCVEDNELNPILNLSMIEITDELKSSGEFSINLGSKKVVYLDDVGTEETPVLFYGTRINFFKDFIEKTYHMNSKFNRLIVSTNINFQQIETKYGFRVRSRMREMFNVLDVSGEDRRR